MWNRLRHALRPVFSRSKSSSAHGESYPMGIHFHVNPAHKQLGTAFGAMMWLWIFYRAKQDGMAVLVRMKISMKKTSK